MAELKITELALPGVKIIEPTYFEDYRGYYCETYSSRTMAQYGINTVFIQDNHSYSIKWVPYAGYTSKITRSRS